MRGIAHHVAMGVLGMLAAGAPAVAQNGAGAADARRPAVRAKAHPDPRVQTLRDMQKRVTVTLEDARLEDVLMFVEQAGNLAMDVAWIDTANPIGLDPAAPITVNARNMTIQSLLESALDRAGDEFNEATWQLTPEGILEIGPKERLNAKRTVKLYDINDLLFVIPNFTDVPELDLDAVLQQSGGRGGGGGGRGVFRVEEQDDLEPDEEARAEEIVEIITTTVEPEQWQVNGGSGASVRFYRGALLVSAPDYIHRQLGGYDFVVR